MSIRDEAIAKIRTHFANRMAAEIVVSDLLPLIEAHAAAREAAAVERFQMH